MARARSSARNDAWMMARLAGVEEGAADALEQAGRDEPPGARGRGRSSADATVNQTIPREKMRLRP